MSDAVQTGDLRFYTPNGLKYVDSSKISYTTKQMDQLKEINKSWKINQPAQKGNKSTADLFKTPSAKS